MSPLTDVLESTTESLHFSNNYSNYDIDRVAKVALQKLPEDDKGHVRKSYLERRFREIRRAGYPIPHVWGLNSRRLRLVLEYLRNEILGELEQYH